MLLFLLLLLSAQDPELGQIEVAPNSQTTLTVDSGRPVDSAAKTLAQRYGVIINSEDPLYLYSADMKDVTAEVVRTPKPGLRVFVPRGGRLQVTFTDVPAALQEVVRAANAQFPFGYRLEGGTFIPTTTRNAQGQIVKAEALLDRKVTIPPGNRRALEHAKIMADALSAATGFRVSCCQPFVAGYPWGMEQVFFESKEEPARSVLTRLIGQVGGRYQYLQRCDPVTSGRDTWCFIHVIAVEKR